MNIPRTIKGLTVVLLLGALVIMAIGLLPSLGVRAAPEKVDVYPSWQSGRGLWLMAEDAEDNTVTTQNANVTGGVKPAKHWMDKSSMLTNRLIVDGIPVKPYR